MAAVLVMVLGLVAGRVEGHLGAAAEALDRGDAPAAGRALALAAIYVDSHLWDSAWSPTERTAARGKERALAQRLTALRTIEERAPLLAGARKALIEARGAKRPTGAAFGRARDVAAACGAAVPDGADTAWKGPAGSLDAILAECGQIARDANAGEARAVADAGARDQAWRAALRGDRLLIYERYGEPSEPDGPEAARAPVWVYVDGPTGPLRQVTRLILTFRGDKLVGRRRTRHAR